MALLHVTKPLFAWDALEDTPALRTIRSFFETLPDEKVLAGLEQARGRGRNDYPVRVLWRVVVLSKLLRHTTVKACLGELYRNPTLCRIVGINSEDEIPKEHNVSRFMDVLGQEPHASHIREAFDAMIQPLGEAETSPPAPGAGSRPGKARRSNATSMACLSPAAVGRSTPTTTGK